MKLPGCYRHWGARAMIAELRGGMGVAYDMHFTHIVVPTLPFLIEQCSL